MFKSLGILFIMKLHAQVVIVDNTICICKRQLFFKEARCSFYM